jgi:excinuclease ABC subunit B
MNQTSVAFMSKESKPYIEPEEFKISIAADPVVQYMTNEQLQKTIEKTKKSMEKAAKELDFIEAARLRDEMFELKKRLA